MILFRLEGVGWTGVREWRAICEAQSFHHVVSSDPMAEERAKGDLLLEFRNRQTGFTTGKWTLYRLYFEPDEVTRLEHVLELNALDGLRSYGDIG